MNVCTLTIVSMTTSLILRRLDVLFDEISFVIDIKRDRSLLKNNRFNGVKS